jgi:hypothetical protein
VSISSAQMLFSDHIKFFFRTTLLLCHQTEVFQYHNSKYIDIRTNKWKTSWNNPTDTVQYTLNFLLVCKLDVSSVPNLRKKLTNKTQTAIIHRMHYIQELMLQPLQLTYHVRIFIWICDTNVCQLNVQVLVHRMQCATYAETNTWSGVWLELW